MHHEEWDWLIAPHPEEHATHDCIHTVSAKVYQRNVSDAEAAKAVDEGLADDADLGLDDADPADSLGDIIPER